MAMDAGTVAAVAAVGAVSGALINDNVSSPVTGKGIVPALVGIAIAVVAWKWVDMDGVGDFIEGAGIGMAIDAMV